MENKVIMCSLYSVKRKLWDVDSYINNIYLESSAIKLWSPSTGFNESLAHLTSITCSSQLLAAVKMGTWVQSVSAYPDWHAHAQAIRVDVLINVRLSKQLKYCFVNTTLQYHHRVVTGLLKRGVERVKGGEYSEAKCLLHILDSILKDL